MSDVPAVPRPVPYERASFVLAALALLAALLLHLVPALLAGFLAWALLQSMARRLRGGRVSHGLARALAAGLLGLVAAGLVDPRDRPPLGVRPRADRRPSGRAREDGGDARAPEGDARGRGRLAAAPGARRIDRGRRRLAARARGRAAARGDRRRPRPRARAPRGRRRRPRLLPRPVGRAGSARGSSSRRGSAGSARASAPSRRPRSRSRP